MPTFRDFVIHFTSNGDRWDTLATKYYGNAFLYKKIIEANPTIAITANLPLNIKIIVPIIENYEDTEVLPPWKR